MGMPEYHDGSFGPIKPVEESLADLQRNPEEQAKTKMLHIGGFDELMELGSEKIRERLKNDEALALIPQSEWNRLRMDVNRILIHLGIDDKSAVLPVQKLPE